MRGALGFPRQGRKIASPARRAEGRATGLRLPRNGDFRPSLSSLILHACQLLGLPPLSHSRAGTPALAFGRVAQLVRALLSHSRGPGFESLRVHFPIPTALPLGAPRVCARPEQLMAVRHLRSLLIATVLCVWAPPVAAQRPTADEAQELLRTRPDLVAQLRQRIATSGLTPAQVRARLRAEGYPENLLDAYLVGSRANGDSLPSEDVFVAVRSLGIADSADVDELAADAGYDPRRIARRSRDTAAARRNGGTAARDTARLAARGEPDERLGRRDTVPDEPRLFGLDVFRSATSQFQPNLSGPVDANYRLGPGDQLVLILTGDVELAHQLQVTREGFVVIPQVGQLSVANLTLAQLEDLLYARLGRVYSGVRRNGGTTRFSVSVARLRANQVFVVGDVEAPGSYQVSSAGTALTALYAAGGPSDNGSLRRVEIRRGGRLVDTLDVYDYLLRGDASHDVRLQTGDVVFVPVHGPRVTVQGEVVRPAMYELRPGETLRDLLRAAGGFTARAARRRVQIERILAPTEREAGGRDRVVLDVASEELANGYGPALALLPGDVVRVFPVAERVRNRIAVRGNVWAPGAQGFQPGMRLSEALRLAGGVKPDVYLGQVLVTRTLPDSTRVQLRARLRDTSGTPVEDLELREDDEIRVFSSTEFRPERYVAITGAVRRGGRFPYREGMTVRDLVLLAGGLEESAYLREAEIARLPDDRSRGATARTFRVPLDSTYLFERGPDGRYPGPPGLPAPSASAPETPVLPYDNVLILRQPDWELQRTVTIAGEVQFPGTYALLSKDERLTDVIRRAGGLSRDAYADGVHFTRRTLGRIGIDLPEVLRDARHQDNLILQDGDSVFVPVYQAVVNVTGAVNSPVAVAYVRGASLDYYVRAAGGPSRKADMGRAYVTQPNGKVESRGRTLGFSTTPEPKAGSSVFVPEKDPADRRDYVGMAGAIAQVLASIVAIVVVATR